MNTFHMIAFTLLVVGGLNWGLIALFNFDLVKTIVGPFGLDQIVYILVGASALWLIFTHKDDCKVCAGMMGGKKGRR